eukprot:1254073-Amorphochlora_amoeboformis.AAC.1
MEVGGSTVSWTLSWRHGLTLVCTGGGLDGGSGGRGGSMSEGQAEMLDIGFDANCCGEFERELVGDVMREFFSDTDGENRLEENA